MKSIESNKQIRKNKPKRLNRFNLDPKNDQFINNFQEILRERLILSYIKKYNLINVNRITIRHAKTNSKNMDTKVKDGLLLSCRVQPEIYLRVQDILKKVIGQHLPMDEFLEFLLMYFVYIYGRDVRHPKIIPPFRSVNPGASYKNLKKFQNTFGKYYIGKKK